MMLHFKINLKRTSLTTSEPQLKQHKWFLMALSLFFSHFINAHRRPGGEHLHVLFFASLFHMPSMLTLPHKYLILPNPDRKCPRQWSTMLSTDPLCSFSLSLSLSSPQAEWSMCPLQNAHLETFSLRKVTRCQQQRVCSRSSWSVVECTLKPAIRGIQRRIKAISAKKPRHF